eukprot:CAMPEP_0172563352 /NCGR_PEP_ID=MMETSP1067-20121228/100418_1 /TAXON_ID=265564 ORGANISM="Thalassiosira punctigera, Strain Tpunct2005C2" /NCGR_SAMPLE_ID=MMETSP1067 /ASSEMBLY_ACC=CAM_ASM_000444 /LENGTH=94 /DNA_ID=CAMNT_0013353781 /DNA_START=116 /DNA_END=396 /DNA_ORIENTATION=-
MQEEMIAQKTTFSDYGRPLLRTSLQTQFHGIDCRLVNAVGRELYFVIDIGNRQNFLRNAVAIRKGSLPVYHLVEDASERPNIGWPPAFIHTDTL